MAHPLLKRCQMKTLELNEPETLAVRKENIITLPLGLLGFEKVTQYVLLANEEEAPFLWLQMLDNASQGFVVVPPAVVLPAYAPDISQQDIEFLGIESPADAIVLNICTIRPDGSATVNLKGPIILNRRTLVGKQVIPGNAASFSLQHALKAMPVAA